MLTAVGSAAAAAAVIAGIVALAVTNPGIQLEIVVELLPRRARGRSREPHASRPERPTPSIAFGDVSNPRTLGAEVEARLAVSLTPLTAADNPLPATLGPAGGELPHGGSGDLGIVGPQGPSGAQGGTGIAGGFGPQGVTGPVGNTGASGAPGAIGAVGPSPTGPRRSPPCRRCPIWGRTGPPRPAGVTGPRHGIGAFGSQGLQGDEGIIGDAGPDRPVDLQLGNKSASDRSAQGADAVAGGAGVHRRDPAPGRHHRRRPCSPGPAPTPGYRRWSSCSAHGHGYVVYVLAASDCSLLSQQTLP